MTMSPGLRKLALTAHVTTSVGWLGAVAASLGLGVAGMTLQDPERGARGLSRPGTDGLVRPLLVMNVFASIVLLLYMQTLGVLADLCCTARPLWSSCSLPQGFPSSSPEG